MSTCTDRLTEARAALHALLTGSKKVRVSYTGGAGESTGVEYSQVNLDQLRAYISQLEAECGDGTTTAGKRGGPFEVIW